jgi:putative membrane protein (TIGR04086 family)
MKIISIFIGCFLSLNGKNGFVKGALSGILFAVIFYFIFSLVCGGVVVNKAFFINLSLFFIVGAISGVIAVNSRK